jgi:histidyl-tRNA synthetase
MDDRGNVIRKMEDLCRIHGYRRWDGPAFERLETLKKKAGPSVVREIYGFQDKSGRELGLRFELTTSLARIIASYPGIRKPIKAYNIGTAWRYERPQQGRYREFVQADADIVGSGSMVCEAELLLLAGQAMAAFGFDDFRIRLNNRKILHAQASLAGIPEDKHHDAFRSLDKYDKIGPEGVREEFLKSGLTRHHFAQFIDLMKLHGDNEARLQHAHEALKGSPLATEGLDELRQILGILETAAISQHLQFSPTLVRGLDYYTGPIFETEITSGKGVGSVSGGGRYDNLVGLFGGSATPATGISFGIERLVDLIKGDECKSREFDKGSPTVQVVYGTDQLANALEIIDCLRRRHVPADMDLETRSFRKQLRLASRAGARYALIVGEEEASSKLYALKDLRTGEQKQYSLDDAIARLQDE